jgi:hypothetical protein
MNGDWLGGSGGIQTPDASMRPVNELQHPSAGIAMMPLLVFALGMPEHLWVLLSATALAVVLPFVIGLAVSTYLRAIAASAILALTWVPVAIIFGIELKARVVLVAGVMLLALVAHTLRRLVGRLRAQRHDVSAKRN